MVAGFAGRLAQDHAEQEFANGLRDLVDRLAAHPGAPVPPVAPRHKHYVST